MDNRYMDGAQVKMTKEELVVAQFMLYNVNNFF